MPRKTGSTDHQAARPTAISGDDKGNAQAAPASVISLFPAPDTLPRPEPSPRLRLRILATTDLHTHLLSYDYYANRPQFGMGLAQTACLIAEARAEVPGAILLDNGDFLQGSALGDLGAAEGRRRPHPAIVAFNTLGYDAVALGNHEFNYGLPLLETAMRAARFPVLSANVARTLGPTPHDDALLALPYVLIDRDLPDGLGGVHRLRIGILGLTPPQIMEWDRHQLEGRIAVRPMIEAVNAWVPHLRRAGADVVICLAHTGLATDPGHGPGLETGAEDIGRIAGVDAVIAGHSHLVHPPVPLHRMAGEGPAPVVQPGHSGSHLGVIDLWLSPGPTGWQVTESRSLAQSVSEFVAGLSPQRLRLAAAPLRAALGTDHRAALDWMRRRLGQSEQPLHTYFAAVADGQAMRLIGAALCIHTRQALQGRPEAALPIVASVTPFRMGGRSGPLNFTEIPAGPLSLRNVFDLYPFPNTLVAERVSGAALRARLERASALYHQLRPGIADQPLIDTAVPTSSFEIITGLSYRIDLSRAPGAGRIRDLALNGQPLADEAQVVLATNSFLAGSAPSEGGQRILDNQTLCTTVLTRYIRDQQGCGPIPGPGWSFVPMPRTSFFHDTGPGAPQLMEEVAHLAPEFLGVTPQGFHRFRLQPG